MKIIQGLIICRFIDVQPIHRDFLGRQMSQEFFGRGSLGIYLNSQFWIKIQYLRQNHFMATIFEQLGGEAAVGSVVEKFYELMLEDPVVNYYFANTDMAKQKQSQKQFISLVTGGPNNYHGADMKTAHQKFKIGKKQFDATWTHLQESLLLHGVSQELITQVKNIFYSVQDQVVNVKIEKRPLFERLGGQAAISAVVDKFYQFMLADPITAPFFANTDMKKQSQSQKAFITMVTGGPNNYHGMDMKKAHEKFKIGKIEFDQTWHNLQKALGFFKVPSEQVAQLRAVFYSVENDVETVKKSLFERLGGEGAISLVVEKFYQYMLSDQITAPFFANTDMTKQKQAQKAFITMVTGGPNNYHGADMKTAHEKFKIGKKQFDETWSNLEKALKFYNVPALELNELKAIFYSVQSQVETQKKSLFERLGGEAAISAVVDKFYEYMLSDPITAPFFAKTDMRKQSQSQKAFITMVTGGPSNYHGMDMKKAHQKFKIGKKQFDQTWHNLEKSLNFFKVPASEISQLKAVFYSVENQVETVKPSLYQRLGGEGAISAVIDKFYEFMLADPITAPFFSQTDMNKQRQSQKAFISMVTGGPNNYHGMDMKKAHQKFKIGKKEFDQTWHNLVKALQFFKVPTGYIHELKSIFYSVESQVETVQTDKKSLFERLGGEEAISAVIDKFYEYMLADPIVSPFFVNTDMDKQRKRQKQFIMMVTGGPNNYEGTDMKSAHQKFKIGKKQFDQTWVNLQKSLNFFKVPQREMKQLKEIFYSVQKDVQNKKQSIKTNEKDAKQFSRKVLLGSNVEMFKKFMSQAGAPKKSLFDRLGGQAAISAVVDKFYEFMLSDPVTAPFFANTDMKKQIQAQKAFITMVTGGPNHYHGADMKKAHEKFKIGKKEFDQTWHNLDKSLRYFKVPETEVSQLKAVFYSVQHDVQTVKSSLFERLGGEKAISAVIDKFYEFMLADPITAPFFANTDMQKQRQAQKNFITMVVGGPNNYHGMDMKKAHQKFKIGKKQFDQTWHNLQKALGFFNVPVAQVSELKSVFYSVQNQVETVKNTLFERLGGQAAISAVVDKFYEYMLADPVTAPFFENTDMNKQRKAQKDFITMVTGGPCNYHGLDMKKAHEKFKIGKKEFNQTWHNLEKALIFFKVPSTEISDLRAVFYSVKSQVETVHETVAQPEYFKKSLYERLGGESGINEVIDKFYEYMLADPITGPFFITTDMKKQISSQKAFITMVTGGPSNYHGLDMKKAHARFKIGKKQFDQTWYNLEKALSFFKKSNTEINELKDIFYSVEEDVQTV